MFLIGGALLAQVTSPAINALYPDRPIVPDFLFDNLPYIPNLAYLTDPIALVAILTMLYIIFTIQKGKLAFGLLSIGIMQTIRSCLIILTPLGRPTGNEDLYGIFKIEQHGMFPSGHFMTAFALYLLINKKQNPKIKIFVGILAILEFITLLLSHGHYSIDLIGGGMVAYIVLTELRKRNVFGIQEMEK